MVRINKLAGVVAMAAVLVGSMAVSRAGAAQAPQVEPRTLSAHLATSLIMARQVDREMMEQGLPLTDSMRLRLTVIDRELAGAEALAGSAVVEQGIRNVRANAQKMAAGDANTVSLVNENVIKLYALGINGTMIEGIARLELAVTALKADDRQAAMRQLQEAGRLLHIAHRQGGYHIQNDLEEIQVLLLNMAAAETVSVSSSLVEERVVEVRDHLFDLGPHS